MKKFIQMLLLICGTLLGISNPTHAQNQPPVRYSVPGEFLSSASSTTPFFRLHKPLCRRCRCHVYWNRSLCRHERNSLRKHDPHSTLLQAVRRSNLDQQSQSDLPGNIYGPPIQIINVGYGTGDCSLCQLLDRWKGSWYFGPYGQSSLDYQPAIQEMINLDYVVPSIMGIWPRE